MPNQFEDDSTTAAVLLRSLQSKPAVLPPPQQTLTQAQKLAEILKGNK